MLTTEYDLFRMKDDESIQDMHTRFTSIINELHYLGETIPRNKLVRKILSVLPSSWESKDNERREPKREKNLVLKTDINDSSSEDDDMAYLIRRFQKMVRRNEGIPKRANSSKPKIYDLCHKCGKPGHFIKEFPLLKQDQYKNNFDKATKRNPVPDKCFNRKNVVDNIVKQALAAWGDSSSESEKENDHGDSSTMAVESEATDLINDKDVLTVELGEAEQTRDDLVIIVVDLKETIENLKKEKDALDEKITNIEHERDDLMVVVVDLKETFECVRKEKEVLAERVANIEHERDDLLVVVVDLKEIIVKSSLCAELEKNKQLHEELGRVKSDLEKSLKWTWSSDVITAMYTNNGGNRQGIGFQREKIPYNPHSKDPNSFEFLSLTPNFLVQGTVKESSLQWYMDSDCSKHMTGSTSDFLSLKALQGGSVSFGNDKKGYILGVGWIEKSLSYSIENVYYMNGLKYSLLSVSQICDKGNKVELMSKICTVTNIMTGKEAGSCKLHVAEQIGQEGPSLWSAQVKFQGSQSV
ncbi:uncharacterized protein LOC142180174 [Nicotiana tabacum]|uniref:Uncharacterized protein LOC142179235 n=2 Tax=Nicotiana tabacum TaxID=4097 RepID=A0AC58U6U5_TOBAC